MSHPHTDSAAATSRRATAQQTSVATSDDALLPSQGTPAQAALSLSTSLGREMPGQATSGPWFAPDTAAGATFDEDSIDNLVAACRSMPAGLLPDGPAETRPRWRGRWTPETGQRDLLTDMIEGMSDYGA